mmetsp:Transcript_33539/g.85812  ORF Transcript_33539/g.85812 Transcript_33539/m.85812 type:complete len:251 (-) Transcript_33539:905-1657(-)
MSSTRGVPLLSVVSRLLAKSLKSPLTPTSSFFRLSLRSLPKRRMHSVRYSRFHCWKDQTSISWSCRYAARSVAFMAEPLFLMPNCENLAAFALISPSSSAAFFSSSTCSIHPVKAVWRRPESFACVMRESTDLAPSFWFCMNSFSFASAPFKASSSSLFFLYSSQKITHAFQAFCFRPSSLPAFMRARTASALLFAAPAQFFRLWSSSPCCLLSSSRFLTSLASVLRAARQLRISLPCASPAVRLSTFLT